VSDIGTRDLMTAYYNGLEQGLGRSEALRAVQLKMMADSRKRHPFYWASFILSGEWRAIRFSEMVEKPEKEKKDRDNN
jgi:CHAT domain-containing protein